jgi:sugar (pentulose or hexulose) kinase
VPVGSHDVTIVLGAGAMRASGMTAGVGAVIVPLPLVMAAPSGADVVRATLEFIAFALRANLEQLEEVSDRRIGSLRLGGGMSRSTLFAQIVADVIDRPVEVARTPETTALGAAVLAAVALGVYRTPGDATSAMCGARARFEPDLRASTEYEDHYAQWCAMTGAMERAAGAGA